MTEPSQESVEIKVLRAEVAALKVECERLTKNLELTMACAAEGVKAAIVAQAVMIKQGLTTSEDIRYRTEMAEQQLSIWLAERNN